MKTKISKNQESLLRTVNATAACGKFYLDQNGKEYAALKRLANRGLVRHTGEGEGRWRVYWDATDAGKAVTGHDHLHTTPQLVLAD